jgi:uncharacterized membrane protein
MGSIGSIFFRGLVTLLPVALTIYILYSAIVIIDNFLGHILRELLPTYIPGLGLLAIVGLTFAVGLLLNNLVIGKFLSLAEKKILEVPLIRAVYSPLKDLMNLFSRKDNRGLRQVVFVKLPHENLMMGLVTRDSFEELNVGHLLDSRVAVYLPFSYGLGGYTILVPKQDLIPVNIPIEKAMSLSITGWVKTSEDPHEKREDT